MTFKELALEVTKREGKKQQVNIAQVSEILRCLGEILAEEKERENKYEYVFKWVPDTLPKPKKPRKCRAKRGR